MKSIKVTVLILIGFSLVGCDIPGRLIIVNKTKQNVEVNLSSFPSSLNEMEMSKIELNKENSRAQFIYGFGGFSEQDFLDLYETLKEVRIISGADTTVVDEKEKLNTMLPKRRTGLFNSVMKIKIKNSP